MSTTLAPEGALDKSSIRAGGTILRDIVRGGIAGVVAGLVVAGIGGRLAMRLALLAVPGSAGSLTENGNVIGAITLPGTVGLILFGAIIGLLFVGASWVSLAPWIPGAGWRRALATMPLAIALGGVGLIDGRNPDFAVLEHAPLVAAVLLLLVGAVGFVVALTDDGLDRILPKVTDDADGRVHAYALLAALGGVLALPALLGALFGGDRPRVWVGLAFLVAGGATLVWWGLRSRGHTSPPRALTLVGRAALVAIVVLGTIDLAPEVSEALGA